MDEVFLLLSVKVTTAFKRLTGPERVTAFVLDDSVIKRNRSKKGELLTRIYDHTEHKYQRGFLCFPLPLVGQNDKNTSLQLDGISSRIYSGYI